MIYQSKNGALDEQPIFYRLSLVEGTNDKVSFCDSNGNNIYLYDAEGTKIFHVSLDIEYKLCNTFSV